MQAGLQPVTHSPPDSGLSLDKMAFYSSLAAMGMRCVLRIPPGSCVTRTKKVTHHMGDAARKGLARRRARVGQLPVVVSALICGN